MVNSRYGIGFAASHSRENPAMHFKVRLLKLIKNIERNFWKLRDISIRGNNPRMARIHAARALRYEDKGRVLFELLEANRANPEHNRTARRLKRDALGLIETVIAKHLEKKGFSGKGVKTRMALEFGRKPQAHLSIVIPQE